MKILYQNREKNSWIGGDMIQLQRTMEEIEKLGHFVEFNDQPLIRPALRLREFDIVHTFNFQMLWTKYQIWAGHNAKKKVVCSMIFHDTDAFVSYEEQQIMADYLDALIFLTDGEAELAKKRLKIDEKKIYIIPNGIEEFWFEKQDIDPTIEPFVLTVGRLDRTKGQLETAKACRKLGIRYVNIGEVIDGEYAKKCELFGMASLPPMEREKLVRFYSACSVFVLASNREVMPLTVMEAGAQAKPIVLTKNCEWDIPVFRCKNTKESIADNISLALAQKNNFIIRDIVKEMTWDKVALQIEKIYNDIKGTGGSELA